MSKDDGLGPEFGFPAGKTRTPNITRRSNLTNQPEQPNHSTSNPRKSDAQKTIQSIPTLNDSVVLASCKLLILNYSQIWFIYILLAVPEFFTPPTREIQIRSDMKNILEIDFDIDLGLLTRNIPPKELFKEDNDVWDWEQEFSQLNADFTSNKHDRNKA